MNNKESRRIVILGGGFGGVFAAKYLQAHASGDVHIELISRDNFFVFQPLLSEVAGGSIQAADAVSPLRAFLPDVAVRVAEIRKVDFSAKTVHVTVGSGDEITMVPYDQLVISLGQIVDLSRTPGLSDRALVMKDVIDAFRIRNHVLQCLEEADADTDSVRRPRLLTFVVVGGGFTGVEVIGEIQDLIRKSLKYYRNIRPDEIRIVLIQHGPGILPELSEQLADYAAKKLRRRGIEIRLNTGVNSASVNGVETDGGDVIDAGTVIAAIGNAPSPLMRSLPVPLDRGKIVVDRCLRVQGLDDVWALGDNAHIPLGDPSEPNVTYAPPLAQFAVREAKVLAKNVLAHLKGDMPQPFEYRSLGTMASLGGREGVADILGVKITGFFAWAAWRSFYLSLLPSISTRVRVAMDWTLDLIISRSIAEMRTTQSPSRYIRFHVGDLVIEPGADPGGFYVVTSGSFDSETPAPSGEGSGAKSRRLGPGDCFGMPLSGEDAPDQERVSAHENSTVYFVEKGDLKRLAKVLALIKQYAESDTATRPDAGSRTGGGGAQS
jgi:NADH dehydrogenase